MLKLIILHTSLVVLLLFISVDTFAQGYTKKFLVVEVSDSIILHQKGKIRNVKTGEKLPIDALLTIPLNGRIVVHRRNNSKLYIYTITRPGHSTLENFIYRCRMKKISRAPKNKNNLGGYTSPADIRLGAIREEPTSIPIIDPTPIPIIDDVDTLKIPANNTPKEKY